MSVADEIRKLNELREQGLISDAEFERQKQIVLGGGSGAVAGSPYASMKEVPLRNKAWFQILALILVAPVGLITMLFFKAYAGTRDGGVRRVGVLTKVLAALAVILGLTLLAIGGSQTRDYNSTAKNIPSCDSVLAREALRDAVENNAARNTLTLRLLDVTDTHEIASTQSERQCNATLVLNDGASPVGFRLFRGTGGALLVEVLAPYTDRVNQQGNEITERASLGPDFLNYPAQRFEGVPAWPNLSDTNLTPREQEIVTASMPAGPNFAGSVTIVEMNCGVDCKVALAVDRLTGAIVPVPVSGPDHPRLAYHYNLDSRLLVAVWEPDYPQAGECAFHAALWEDGAFRVLGRLRDPCI